MSRRKVLTALELVAHALSTDRSRPHLCKPFGFEWRGNGYIAGTDGHRAALVRSEEWQQHVRDDAPPMSKILDAVAPAQKSTHVEIPLVGVLDTSNELAREARELPRKWNIGLTFPTAADEMPRLNIVTRTIKTRKGVEIDVKPFGPELHVPWSGLVLERLRHPLTIELRYLLDAADHVGTGEVYVHNAGEFDPIVFLPSDASRIEDAERIAIVMPRRV